MTLDIVKVDGKNKERERRFGCSGLSCLLLLSFFKITADEFEDIVSSCTALQPVSP